MTDLEHSIMECLITIALLALPVFAVLLSRTLYGLYTPLQRSPTEPSGPSEPSQPQVEVSKESNTEWFTSPKTFELERRAIFSQTWMCITHVSHFRRPGDYLTFKIADFPFFLILGKDNVLRGFHNVCRHRAYEVTRKPMGSSLVLGCRYHGWSYDTKGNLTKAPQFDEVPGFKKEENSLFQIWVKTDMHGFVFINFDARWDVFDPPSDGLTAFAEYCGASKQSSFVAFWQTEADMNWKQANALLEKSGPRMLDVRRGGVLAVLQRFLKRKSKETTIFFPSPVSALTAISGTDLWSMSVVEPISATKCSIRRTVYVAKSNAEAPSPSQISQLKAEFHATVKQLEVEFRELRNVERTPIASPSQNQLLDLIRTHSHKEREAGRAITPALPLEISEEVNGSNCGIAEKLCRELESFADAGAACLGQGIAAQKLAW